MVVVQYILRDRDKLLRIFNISWEDSGIFRAESLGKNSSRKYSDTITAQQKNNQNSESKMSWFSAIPGLREMEQGCHSYNKIGGDVRVVNDSDLVLECFNNHAYQIDGWGSLNRTIQPGESFDFHIEYYAFPQTNKGDTAAESDYKVYFKGKYVGQLNLFAKDAFIGTKTVATDAYKLSTEPYFNNYRRDDISCFKIFNGPVVNRTMREECDNDISRLKTHLQELENRMQGNHNQIAQLLKEQAEVNQKLQQAVKRRSKYD